MLGALAGFGRRRGHHRGHGRHGIESLERKIQRLENRDARDAEKLQNLKARLAEKQIRWGPPNATTAAATSGAVGTPATVAATAALPPVMPPYPAGTVPPANWNEKAYLDKYPDVAAGVNAGTVPSGLWHYMSAGMKEGRTFSGFDGLEWLNTTHLLLGVGLGAAAFFGWRRFKK